MAEFLGKTVEEAIETGLKTLGIDKENAEITVIEEPSKGFLGFGSKPAKVEVSEKKSDGQRATAFLNGLLDLMNVNAKCNLGEEGEKVIIDIITDTSSSVIGYRGEVLDALQCLAGAVANTGRDDYRRVVVDCEGYREKREETLKSLAEKLAAKAVRTGRKVTLEPMNPYERRILHSTLSNSTEVKTQSEGKEPNRYVAIIPNNLKPYDKKYDDRRGGKGGYNKDRKDYGRGERRERTSAPRQPRPKTSGFGTFLGNSLKDGE
ncbi:MAG: protein jag [Clostridiales bacterium]|nr:protein jag [Clostridiales bacterium]